MKGQKLNSMKRLQKCHGKMSRQIEILQQLIKNYLIYSVNCIINCFPLRKVKLAYNNRISWLTIGLQQSIKYKNDLYKIMHKHPTECNEDRYKAYRSKLTHLLRIAEKQHYQELLEQNKHNCNKTWSILKEVINKKKKTQMSTVFKVGSMLITIIFT